MRATVGMHVLRLGQVCHRFFSLLLFLHSVYFPVRALFSDLLTYNGSAGRHETSLTSLILMMYLSLQSLQKVVVAVLTGRIDMLQIHGSLAVERVLVTDDVA